MDYTILGILEVCRSTDYVLMMEVIYLDAEHDQLQLDRLLDYYAVVLLVEHPVLMVFLVRNHLNYVRAPLVL